jgi:hypothetical protein
MRRIPATQDYFAAAVVDQHYGDYFGRFTCVPYSDLLIPGIAFGCGDPARPFRCGPSRGKNMLSISAIREAARTQWRRLRGGEAAEPIELVVVTGDDRFYSSVLYATTLLNWRARWVRSIERALDIARNDPGLIVIMDASVAPTTWRVIVRHFRVCRPGSCLLLALPTPTDELWQAAIACGAYDVICRRLEVRHFAATVCFASHWHRNIRICERTPDSLTGECELHLAPPSASS